jgi:hypothetical protein
MFKHIFIKVNSCREDENRSIARTKRILKRVSWSALTTRLSKNSHQIKGLPNNSSTPALTMGQTISRDRKQSTANGLSSRSVPDETAVKEPSGLQDQSTLPKESTNYALQRVHDVDCVPTLSDDALVKETLLAESKNSGSSLVLTETTATMVNTDAPSVDGDLYVDAAMILPDGYMYKYRKRIPRPQSHVDGSPLVPVTVHASDTTNRAAPDSTAEVTRPVEVNPPLAKGTINSEESAFLSGQRTKSVQTQDHIAVTLDIGQTHHSIAVPDAISVQGTSSPPIPIPRSRTSSLDPFMDHGFQGWDVTAGVRHGMRYRDDLARSQIYVCPLEQSAGIVSGD